MHEFTTTNLSDATERTSINTLLANRVAKDGAAAIIEVKTALGSGWQEVSAQSFANQVQAIAKGLIAQGVQVGDSVGLMSRTRYEWTLFDFAIWAAGAVSVPVYETSSAEQIEWICTDAHVKLIIVENHSHAALVTEAKSRSSLEHLTKILVIEDDAVEYLRQVGSAIADTEVTARSQGCTGADLATIIYTSGTTGQPKGVELTHANFVHVARNAVGGFGEVCAVPGARTLLFLPLAHVFARFIQVMCVSSGAVMGHCPDTKNLLPDLAIFKPTFLLAVPRVFEKIYNSSERTAGTGAKLKIFRWAAKVAIHMSRGLDTANGPSLPLKAQHRLADKLVYGKLRAAMGGDAKYSFSAGAPLGERLGHFYRGIGLTIFEGYGLTETTAPTAVNLPSEIKIGTVGPVFPGTSMRIDQDGEILVKGQHLFRGYHNNPEATAEAIIDGWFHTGDLGSIDEDGFVRITGRKKEIIVTAGGKNVAPAVLEDRFRGHPLVSQCVVVGDQRPFIGALVTLDAEMLPGWLKTRGLPAMGPAEAAHHPEVLQALDRAAERANRAVSRPESIRKVHVLTTDFTEENGYLTPSLKVKRALVLTNFEDEIDDLYAAK